MSPEHVKDCIKYIFQFDLYLVLEICQINTKYMILKYFKSKPLCFLFMKTIYLLLFGLNKYLCHQL